MTRFLSADGCSAWRCSGSTGPQCCSVCSSFSCSPPFPLPSPWRSRPSSLSLKPAWSDWSAPNPDRLEQEHWEHRAARLRWLERSLSAREWELLQLLANENLTYQQIAAKLYISPKTVKAHVQHIGRKLDVTERRQIVVVARERGLLPPMETSLTEK